MPSSYDVIVIGGGHAGIEASLAASRLGLSTLLISQRLSTIGVLSCNPAFGGPAKGTLIREVDALGGYASLGADRAAVQCRILGPSKGPAARATRNLVDRTAYRDLAQEFLSGQKGLSLLAGEAIEVLARGKRVEGVALADGRKFSAGALVLTGGTFWNGVIYRGLSASPGGRFGEGPSQGLKASLSSLGHRLGRLSTSTAPRLKPDSVRTDSLDEQPGDHDARPFSVLSGPVRNLKSCFLTWTNPRTHRIVSENVQSSIIYASNPVSSGPRYCPSLEDKIMRFPQRERHQIFLEPDGEDQIYPSGLPTGLDPEVQLRLLRTIEGLERVELFRPGYAIEYDFCQPEDLSPALESLLVQGLFMAGQINGTSGYEEAASQGLWAGVGAALRAGGREPLALGRDRALTGVMLDDLSLLGVSEPYRMLTSRAEHRLILREDNADLRLSPLAISLGLLDKEREKILALKMEAMERGRSILAGKKISPEEAAAIGRVYKIQEKDLALASHMTAAEFLKRPQVKLSHLRQVIPELADIPPEAVLSLETEVKFKGYISRQEEEVARLKKQEENPIPREVDYALVPGLSGEATETLSRKRPATLGQASRLRGVTAASISALAVYLRKMSAL
jgi:tRNA uridine 5-carboxymethylaminomethyl modification enzyme